VFAADATFAGHVALPDRAALVAVLAPITGTARDAMRQATCRAREQLDRLVRTAGAVRPGSMPEARAAHGASPASDAATPSRLGQVEVVRRAGADAVRGAFDRHRRGEQLADEDVARLALLLEDPAVRDFAWAHTDSGPQSQQLWTEVTRRAETDQVPAPACLLAFAAFRSGDGVLARVALDRALDADPTYSLALLLSEVLRRGIHPSVFNDLLPVAPDTANQPDHQ